MNFHQAEVRTCFPGNNPVDTRRRFNVDTTSYDSYDVVSTLKRRCVSTGNRVNNNLQHNFLQRDCSENYTRASSC